MKKLLATLLALALAAFALAACGGGDDSTSAEGETTSSASTETTGGAGGGGSLTFVASSGISYDETEVEASAGENTVTFENSSSIPHDVVIEDDGGNEVAATDVISSGSADASADLAAGTYTFYCSVDGHRAQGMEGTITVK